MAQPATLNEALSQIADLRRQICDMQRRLEWADQRPGGGPKKLHGFTDTEARVLRMLAANGCVAYERFEALQRHMSNIRKKLPPAINVRTEVGWGYELSYGLPVLQQFVAGEIQFAIEAVTDALETRTPPKKTTKRQAARNAERKERRHGRRILPRPIVTVIETPAMGMAA